MIEFGHYIRSKREKLQAEDKTYSQRQVSMRIGIEPSYLSKLERCQPLALSEEKIVALAEELGEDPDFLLALGGKISGDIQDIIKKRPMLFSRLVRKMKDLPDETIKADKEFKQLQGKLHRLHELASIGSFQFSDDRTQSYWTKQIPSILGITQDAEPSMDSILEAISHDERKRFIEAKNLALKNNDAYHCELQIAPGTSSSLYILIWGYYEKDEKTLNTVTLGIIQDITETVQLRNEIQAAKNSLQATVDKQCLELSTAIKKLTAEISSRKALEIQLKQTNDEIVEQAKIQSSFFKDHAYSLRSLMSKLINEQADIGPPGPAVYIKRIATKINDMSDFFSSQSNLTLEENSFNLHENLTNTFSEFETDFKENSIELSLFTSPDLPVFILTDKRRMEQIITALLELFLVNTPWGYVQFSATMDAPTNNLIISITSPSKYGPIKKNLFYPQTTKEQAPYESNPTQLVGPIVEMFSGKICIEESSGAGVLINIHLPIKIDDSPKNTTPKTSTGKLALIVEDDMHSRIYMTKVLENRGYEVVSTSTGKEALKQANSKKFNIVLLDIQLPDIDGTQISKTIRRDHNSPNKTTPMIAVTAHATQADREKYLESGIEGFIAKPFEIDALCEELFKHLNKT